MLASLEGEVAEEPSLIAKLLSRRRRVLPRRSILIGAGDSYAAALCASNLSPTETVALDPYELITSPWLARGRSVAFLSVSGRTQSNVKAARTVKGIAAETIAVTAEEASPLAKAVGSTIILPYCYKPRMPGVASFGLMLAASVSLARPSLRVQLTHAFSAGRKMSQKLTLSRGGSTFFLGNGALYALSIYAAAKVYEFFGMHASCQRLEEFSHMELFSLGRRDAVNIFEGFDPLQIGRSLSRSLRKAGYTSSLARADSPRDIERVFATVFAVQHAVLRWARRRKMAEPYLAGAEEKLAVSDSMIY